MSTHCEEIFNPVTKKCRSYRVGCFVSQKSTRALDYVEFHNVGSLFVTTEDAALT